MKNAEPDAAAEPARGLLPLPRVEILGDDLLRNACCRTFSGASDE